MAEQSAADRGRSFPYLELIIPAFDPQDAQEAWWTQEIMGIEMRDEDDNIEIQRIYFETQEQMRHFLRWHEEQEHAGVVTASGQVEYADWESFLHGGFEPFTVGDLFVVPAENTPPIPEPLRPLKIIPGRGFGTGSHPTTRLTMEFLATNWQAGPVLDMGTGSGILSVQAALMGSDTIIAVDTDADSVENARENVAVNGVENAVTLRAGSLDYVPEGEFTLILANIIAPVLRTLIGDGLLEKAAPGAMILFSGILDEEIESFIALLQQHRLEILDNRQMKEWCAVVARTVR